MASEQGHMSTETQCAVEDDPHVIAVITGLRRKSFGKRKAVSILEDCGYSKDEARAALAKAQS